MSAFGDYLENAGLDHFLNVSPLATAPLNLHLYTGDPTDLDTGPEVAGGGYLPVAATFNAAAAGVSTNAAGVQFAEATALWGLVSHFGLKDGGGNLYYHGAFDTAKTIDTGDVAVVGAGDLSVEHQ